MDNTFVRERIKVSKTPEYKEKIQEKLGMHEKTAQNRLTRQFLFSLGQKVGLGFCYRCGDEIDSWEDFSIDHKIPWLNHENAEHLFWDLNNLAFSHKKCNMPHITTVAKVSFWKKIKKYFN